MKKIANIIVNKLIIFGLMFKVFFLKITKNIMAIASKTIFILLKDKNNNIPQITLDNLYFLHKKYIK